MSQDEILLYVASLYKNLMKRTPAAAEFEHWVKFVQDGNGADKLYYAFINSKEYKQKTSVTSIFPAGHYYSPVVDPTAVREYVNSQRQTSPEAMSGLEVSITRMEEFWCQSLPVITTTPFQELKNQVQRFYYTNDIFSYGDAITLRAIIAEARPRSIVEIGSGFSSACMLDCADEFRLETAFTFVDPFPERLKTLLRPEDHRRVTVIEAPVQHTDLSLYRSLRRGDVLFIDSTHVLKTGSDVHYELFHILPCLERGVLIHFHDIQFPFEYPDQWIFGDNHSWNEIYAVQAFLMYNTDFKIRFWGSCLAQTRTSLIQDSFPIFLKNPGGSLWIERT